MRISVLPPTTARYVAVAMLVAATVWVQFEGHSMSAEGIALDRTPRQAGKWRCIKQDVSQAYGFETKTMIRLYEDPEKRTAKVTFQATYTRLGSLRDWSLALTTQGWTVTQQVFRPIQASGGGHFGRARVEELTHGETRQVAASWYTSPTREAATLAQAETRAAVDRLMGRRSPWMGIFVTMDSREGKDETEDEVVKLTAILAPQLRAVAVASAR